MKRSITQLLQPTAPKINGKCQHQSILIRMECINLPWLKFWISEVRCTHKQPPWQIRMHTCAWQALKQQTCAWQAHEVSHLPWCYSLLSTHLADCHVWLIIFRKKSRYFITSQAALPNQQCMPNVSNHTRQSASSSWQCMPNASTNQMYMLVTKLANFCYQ